MSDKHIRFLSLAKELASKTTNMRRGFGCVLVDKNKILVGARNYKSHPKTPTNVTAYNQFGELRYFGLHAEIAVLLKCDFPVRGMNVYVHGQNVRTGNLVNSSPCLLCEKVLKERGIKQAIYSTKEGYAIKTIN